MKLLNLGCGSRFHQDWVNVDFVSTGKGVLAYNLLNRLPFSDNSFDVVYHSHVLEHFPKSEAPKFIKECHRVLRPDGILRIVIPDLEQMAKTYLTALSNSLECSSEWQYNYEWIMLEMYDQTVRNIAGGEMAPYLFQKTIPNKEFVIQRCGIEAKKLIDLGISGNNLDYSNRKLSQIKKYLKPLYNYFRYPSNIKDSLLRILLGKKDFTALQIGRFRQSGEIHQWMYDRYSLGKLLQECCLIKITQRSAHQSYIESWSSYNLDTEPDGTIYKPDSLYVECIKNSIL